MTPEPLTRSQLIKAQQDLCKAKGWPMFASSTGNCWGCGKDCVTDRWATELVTGCNRCCRSFCE